jgi:hypothetical protein
MHSKSLTLLLLLAVGGPFLLGQGDPVERFSQSIRARDFEAHLYFLADDMLEGRETGERGQQLAALYIRSQFMQAGLKPGNPQDGSFFQPFFLSSVEIGTASMNIGKKRFIYGADFFSISGNLPASLAGPLTFAGYGISGQGYDNLSGLRLNGATALILAGGPLPEGGTLVDQIRGWEQRGAGLQAAGAQAALVVVPDSLYKVFARFARTRFTEVLAEAQENGFPMIYVKESVGALLFESAKTSVASLKPALASNPRPAQLDFKKAGFSFSAEVERSVKPAGNVLGLLEGTDKKAEIIVITGHYDHIGIVNGQVNNGADDDGSGTSAVLELAEAFALAAEAGYRPRRSILFMTVSGEEKGLLGSEFYTDNPLYPIAQTVANLNIDMIGRVGSEYDSRPDSLNYVYLIGSDKLSSDLHALSEAANKRYTQLTLDYTYNDDKDPNRFYYRSDHYNFARLGIPVIFYFNGTHVDYHKPGDDPWKIRYEKAAKITRLVFATAWELANREQRIVVDKPIK